MRSVSLETVNEIVDASQHLPNGASLVVPQVDWDDYERVLEELAERRSLRINYDAGRLEIVSPSQKHGRYEHFIAQLVVIFCDVFRLSLEGFGVVTWKRKALLKGIEPDVSFYIKSAKRVIGRDIDLESDPPPDIAVEVDITSDSIHKLGIYASLGIPEVWRYDGRTCRFYTLVEGGYVEVAVSPCLPGLTSKMITDAIELSNTQGQDTARKAFRRTVRALKK